MGIVCVRTPARLTGGLTRTSRLSESPRFRGLCRVIGTRHQHAAPSDARWGFRRVPPSGERSSG
jgi:hypothetical protein